MSGGLTTGRPVEAPQTVALFITLPGRHDVPADGTRGGRRAGATRHTGGVPARADLLRPDALQHRVCAGGGSAGEAVRARVRGVRGGGLAIRVVRGDGARPVSARGRAGRRSRSRARGVPRSCRVCSSSASCSSTGSEVEDVGAYFPHRVTYHPTCHGLRMLQLGDRPQRLLRSVRGIDIVELPEAKECCGFGGTFAVKNADTSIAMLTDKVADDPGHGRRGVRRGGQLLPHAHRWRALAPARRGEDAPSGGGARFERRRRKRGMSAAELSARRARRAGRHPAPAQSGTCHADDPRQACGRWSERWPTGRSCARQDGL